MFEATTETWQHKEGAAGAAAETPFDPAAVAWGSAKRAGATVAAIACV